MAEWMHYTVCGRGRSIPEWTASFGGYNSAFFCFFGHLAFNLFICIDAALSLKQFTLLFNVYTTATARFGPNQNAITTLQNQGLTGQRRRTL